MRKAFIEPDMKVIKLNLNENIATSENYTETGAKNGLIYYIDGKDKSVISTGYSVSDVDKAYDDYWGTPSIQTYASGRENAIEGIVGILGDAIRVCLA